MKTRKTNLILVYKKGYFILLYIFKRNDDINKEISLQTTSTKKINLFFSISLFYFLIKLALYLCYYKWKNLILM